MMRDGFIGVAGTGGTIMLQEVSLVLSIVCAVLTISHFTMLFYSKWNTRKGDGDGGEKEKEK